MPMKSPMDQLPEMAMTAGTMIDIASMLACPRLASKLGSNLHGDKIIACIDRYLAVVAASRSQDDKDGAEPQAHRLRELCSTWTSSSEAPSSIQQAARAFLEASGIAEPAGGWDAFDGDQARPPVPTARAPRTIVRLSPGPNWVATELSNAMSVIQEFTSPRRLATLAHIPTRDELIHAIDTHLRLGQLEEELIHLRKLRGLVATWTPGIDVPKEIQETVRAYVMAGLDLVPLPGWDAYDGYPGSWMEEPTDSSH